MNEPANETETTTETDDYLRSQTAFGDMIFRRSRAYKLARSMPAGLLHKFPDEAYSIDRSQVIQWLVSQPTLQAYLFERMSTTGAIVFDRETRTWRGVDTPKRAVSRRGCLHPASPISTKYARAREKMSDPAQRKRD